MSKLDISKKGAEIGFVLGGFSVIILISCSFVVGTFPSYNIPAVNLLFTLLGGLMGWILGVLITPNDQKEKIIFSNYGQAISTFLTGFLLAKLEKVFELAIQDENDISDLLVARALLLFVSFCLGILFTSIWRTYIANKTNNEAISKAQKNKEDKNIS